MRYSVGVFELMNQTSREVDPGVMSDEELALTLSDNRRMAIDSLLVTAVSSVIAAGASVNYVADESASSVERVVSLGVGGIAGAVALTGAMVAADKASVWWKSRREDRSRVDSASQIMEANKA